MENKHTLELDQANHFMEWIAKGNFKLIERPELQHPSRKGGRPDFRFEDDTGHGYVLELTRFLNKNLRKLEDFVLDNICTPLKSQVSGTFILEIPVDPIGCGWIDPQLAKQTRVEISRLLQSSNLSQSQQLSNRFVFSKVRDDGNRIDPWLTAETLPPELALNDPIAKELENEFHNIVQGAEQKFDGYTGARILLIGLSQSGLDLEFHAKRFKGGQGIMLMWAENESETLVNVDYIYLEPGVGVWQLGPSSSDTLRVRKVFAGHKYANSRAGYYFLLWRRPGAILK